MSKTLTVQLNDIPDDLYDEIVEGLFRRLKTNHDVDIVLPPDNKIDIDFAKGDYSMDACGLIISAAIGAFATPILANALKGKSLNLD